MAKTSISKSTSQNSFAAHKAILARKPVTVNDCLVYLTIVRDTLTKRDYIHVRAINSVGKAVFAWGDFCERSLVASASEAAYQFITQHPNKTQLEVFKQWAKRWDKQKTTLADRLFIGRSEL